MKRLLLSLTIFVLLGLLLGACIAPPERPASTERALGSITGSGNAIISGTLTVSGTQTNASVIRANAGLTVDTTAFSVADTTGNTVVSGTLSVTGTQTLTGATTHAGLVNANAGIAVDTSAFTVADATGDTVISGTLAANNGISVDTSAFTVANATGNTVVSGTLSVTGTLSVMGTTLISNTMRISDALTLDANLIFEGATADGYETTLTADDPLADASITLPNANGKLALIAAAPGTALLAPGLTTIVIGTSSMTGTVTVTHGLTTPLYALCSIGTPVQTAAEALCSVVITGSTVTLNTWAVDGVTPGVAAATVFWQVAGTP
jgi:fibronectin-binding autotransporter adhesin